MSDDVLTVEEQYTSATHASNLRVEADRRGSADVIIAAAWSPIRLGSALLRLHSEFDGCEHPKRGTKIYMHEFAILLGRLKTMPEVRHQLTMQADRWGVFNPADVASAVLLWWLFRVCPACNGVKFELVKGANVKSTKLCKCCRGSGEAKLPYLEEGRRLANHIDACIGEARHSIKKRLRNTRM